MTSAISMGGGSSALLSLQQQLFSKVDANGDKSIDKAELTSFLEFVGEQTGSTAVDAESAIKAIDTDGNGSISESELQTNGDALFDQLRAQLTGSQASGRGPRPPPPSDSTEMFSSIDTNGDGTISAAELEAFLTNSTSEDGNGPTAADILARDDSDGDGSISAAEFEAATSHRPPPPDGSGGGFGRMISSLLDQYAAVNAASSSSATTSLSIAA